MITRAVRRWTARLTLGGAAVLLLTLYIAIRTWPVQFAIAGILAAATAGTYGIRRGRRRWITWRNGARGPAVLDRPLQPFQFFGQQHALSTYLAMDDKQFEHAVARLLTDSGCAQAQVSGGAGDLGKDVSARLPDGRLVITQCKKYAESHKVGSSEMQCFGGTCYAIHRADVALFVTTSTFTQAAIDYAAHVGIRLIDGPALARWADGGTPPWN